jgi:hypothetical protein
MIKAEVLNQKIRLDAEIVAANSVNFLEIKFILDNSWNGTVKTAVFENEGFKTAVIMEEGNPLYLGDNTCLVPFEVIKPPFFSVSINGIGNEKVITTIPSKIKVYESGDLEADTPGEYTPSQYEQLVLILGETKQIAFSVRQDADNGLFKGDKGDKGDKGAKGDKGDRGEIGPQGPQGVAGAVTPEFIALSDSVNSNRILAETAAERAQASANAIIKNEEQYLSSMKNKLTGKIISVNDISPIEHNMEAVLSSDTITDFSSVSLTKCGINIFDLGKLSDYERNHIILSVSENGLIGTKTQSGAISHIFNLRKIPNGTYRFKGIAPTNINFLCRLYDENGNILTRDNMSLPSFEFNTFYKAWISTVKNNAVVTIPENVAYWNLGMVFEIDKAINNIQISHGTEDYDYEPFSGTYYSANTDGTFAPISSSNTVNLLTDNPEANINLIYNADIKLYIDNKFA